MLSESMNMDQTLTDREIPEDDRSHDHYGVSGVWTSGEDVPRLTYFSLHILQHRRQQSVGVAISSGEQILVYKDQGLVNQVFIEQTPQGSQGHLALGHVRYAIMGEDTWRNAQPILGPILSDTLALRHNGNLTNTVELRDLARSIANEDEDVRRGALTNTSVATALLGLAERTPGPVPLIPSAVALADPIGEGGASSVTPDEQLVSVSIDTEPAVLVVLALRVLPRLKGVFSLVFMDEDTLYGARDPYRYCPLVFGCLYSGWVFTPETAALDPCGTSFVCEIEPGESVAIGSTGVHSCHPTIRRSNTCVFEYVYLTHPNIVIGDRQIVAIRRETGVILTQESPVDTDLVIPTPESGTPAIIGYVEASGIPFTQGLMKNAYMGRTFIQPTQSLRQLGIRLKLNPLREVITGKCLTVIDDLIVRGNTQRALVCMLREAGAAEAHVKVSSPLVAWPCFFGTDLPTRAGLVVSPMDVEEVRASIGTDFLSYLSMEGMAHATRQGSSLRLGCLNGAYPEQVPEGIPTPGTPSAFAC